MQGSETQTNEQIGALPNEARRIVNLCLARIAAQPWPQRRATIEATIAAGAIPLVEEMTGAIVAAVIECLGTPEIFDSEQAQLFAMSACLDHQIAACDWFIKAADSPAVAISVSLSENGVSLH